jgi:hypothetical protein
MKRYTPEQSMKLVGQYGERFGQPVPMTALQHTPDGALEARIEQALAENKPVPEWSGLPASDVINDRPLERSTRIDDDELHRSLEIRAAKTAAKDRERLKREADLHRLVRANLTSESPHYLNRLRYSKASTMESNQPLESAALTAQYMKRFATGIRPDVYETTTRDEMNHRMQEALRTGVPITEWQGPITTLLGWPTGSKSPAE